MELGDRFFRREAGRMVAVLTNLFGVHNLALAEDVVQAAFCRALEVWPFNEGYHGASAESAVRIELCQEALRLTSLLVEHPRSRPA